MPCTSLPPLVPRRICRSDSILTKRDKDVLTSVDTAGASSIASSERVIDVATFLTFSSTVDHASVLSGFSPPSATPAAALVAVP
jgi:hypothetical protein